jgi:mRNA-degrading endonuclease toxin of MazEF toxin-antitoxin module
MEKVCLAGQRPATVRTGKVRQETTGVVVQVAILTQGRVEDEGAV